MSTPPTRLEIWSVWTVGFLTLLWGLYCVDFNRLEFNEDFLNAQFDAVWWIISAAMFGVVGLYLHLNR